MEQISNKALLILLIAAIVVSVGGTLVSLYKISTMKYPPEITGMASTGRVNASIEGVAAINVTTNVDFGSGTTDGQKRHISTEDSDNYGSFRNCSGATAPINPPQCRGMELENTGNTYINVTLVSDKNRTEFFSGDPVEANFTFFTANGNRTGGEVTSCKNNTAAQNDVDNVSPTTWTEVPKTTTLICDNLSAGYAADTITIEFNLTIPSDEPAGEKKATITFAATSI